LKGLLYILFFLFSINLYGQSYLKVNAKSGDGIKSLLERYDIPFNDCSKSTFLKINNKSNTTLTLTAKYSLPIRVYNYNSKSIRTTIGTSDYEYALSIQRYNDLLLKRKVKAADYRNGGVLWVKEKLNCVNGEVKAPKVPVPIPQGHKRYEIFGEKYQDVKTESNSLKGHVYYLVSGHGGPDPGAIGDKDGNMLCEDEYAYDVVLRLGRYLISNGALVHIIIKDEQQGVKDDQILTCNRDEKVNGKKIPLNQVSRLSQRTTYINSLYRKYRKQGYTNQKAVMIHIDSRNVNKNIDVFFYHHEKSKTGKRVANNLFSTFKYNYEKYQKGRGYQGSVSSRNLYMINNTDPTAIYIELGNIRNKQDHKRLLIPENREAVAKWLYEGLSKK